MTDRVTELEARMEDLAARVRVLESHLAAAERRDESLQSLGEAARGTLSNGPASLAAIDVSPGFLALAGRTLVALGGGYLIRASTDAGMLPAPFGMALGLLYALAWLALADRAAALGRRTAAVFDGLTSGLIAYPLLWETTVRLGLLRPPAALALVFATFAAGMVVARRRGLSAMAWTSTLLALATAASLLVSTHHLLATLAALLGIAAVVEWRADEDRWTGLRWLSALLLDAVVLLAIDLVSRPEGLPEGYPPLSAPRAGAAVLVLPLLYVASLVARTLRHRRPISFFDVLQVTVAVVLGLGGAWAIVGPAVAPAVGIASLLLGALGYAAAFAFVERCHGHARNFYFYSTAGGGLSALGARLLLGDTALALAWCLMALVAAGLGRRFDRMTLRFHAALYLWGAAAASGLLTASWTDFLASEPQVLALPTGVGWLVGGALLAGYALLAGSGAPESQGRDRLAQGLAATLLVWTLGAIVVAAVAAVWSSPGAAEVATLRTGVGAALAVALGPVARRWSLPEMGWLVYPLLALGGLKLVVEDLSEGRPSTLFLSLVLYGGALILAPRLLRRSA